MVIKIDHQNCLNPAVLVICFLTSSRSDTDRVRACVRACVCVCVCVCGCVGGWVGVFGGGDGGQRQEERE